MKAITGSKKIIQVFINARTHLDTGILAETQDPYNTCAHGSPYFSTYKRILWEIMLSMAQLCPS